MLEEIEKLPRLRFRGNCNPKCDEDIFVDAVAQDVLLDLPVSGVNAMVQYFVFGSDHLATRQGVLNVVWNSGMIGAPYLLDTPAVAVGLVADLQWAATVVSGPHVALQYTNQTGDTPTVFFRIDRPFG